MDNQYKNIKFKELCDELGPEFIQNMNEAQIKTDEHDFNGIRDGLKKGICYICGKPLNYVDENNPCFHWLINPNVKKKLLNKLLYSGIGLFRLYGYLTWVANSNKPFANIDDTSEGNDSNKLFESTIRYKEFEWTFSLAKTDFEGHLGTNTDYSHFHIQMKKNGNVIIKFNDYHIPFSDNDKLTIEMMSQDVMTHIPSYEAGMNFFSELDYDEVLPLMTCAESENSAPFRTQTLIAIPEHCKKEVSIKFQELQQNTNWTAPKIIEYLNKEFGYGIMYKTQIILNNPITKSHRK